MFEIQNIVRQQAKELRVLAGGVGRVRLDWERTIEATRFLGDGMPVEAWFLAECFLAMRADWHLVRSRFDRYFGTSGGRWPRWWLDLDRRCEQIAAELAEDDQLRIDRTITSPFGYARHSRPGPSLPRSSGD